MAVLTHPIARLEIPEQFIPANGWVLNPRRPVEVRLCPRHGEYRRAMKWDDPRCYWCRSERRRTDNTRTPPRPPFEQVGGACSLCGTSPLPGRRRSWCSDECVDLWSLATMPAVATKQLRCLHGHACWQCGQGDQFTRLELEHTRPLWSLTDDQRLELRWWLPFNLALLCPTCHGAKTRWEAGLRAAIRRGDIAEWYPWPGLDADPIRPAAPPPSPQLPLFVTGG